MPRCTHASTSGLEVETKLHRTCPYARHRRSLEKHKWRRGNNDLALGGLHYPRCTTYLVIDDQKPRHSPSMTIRMTVPPIPILILLPVIQRRVFPVFLVLFSKIYAVASVLVVIPIVVVLVRAIVNACLFFFVSVVVLGRRARSNCHGCGQCGAQEKKTYVSISGFHYVFLLSLRNPMLVSPLASVCS